MKVEVNLIYVTFVYTHQDTVLRVQVPVNTSEPQKPLSTPDQVDSVDFQQVSVKTP